MRFSSTSLLALVLPLVSSFSLQQPAFLRGSTSSHGIYSLPLAYKVGHVLVSGSRRETMRMTSDTDTGSRDLPGYTKIGKIKIAGMDASLLVGPAFVIACFGWAAALYPAIGLCYLFSKQFDKNRRRGVDWIVHWWAKLTCWTIFYSPTVIGIENLPAADEAVMYIPNHCSYLDIFTLSGFIPRPFKYVSKIEILRIPLIGWAMQAAGHIAIRRMDKRSQLQTFKDTVECLQNGNSIVTFAEGTRSKTGRMMVFKKGPIKMAIKAKKRIVPVSICDLHRWMPDTAVTPLGIPSGVVIKIHPPIDVEGRDENLILLDTFNAINGGLPDFQKNIDNFDELFNIPGTSVSV